MKKYIVELISEERSQLREIINAERMAAHKRRHARMLLKLGRGPHSPGWSDTQAARGVRLHVARSAELAVADGEVRGRIFAGLRDAGEGVWP